MIAGIKDIRAWLKGASYLLPEDELPGFDRQNVLDNYERVEILNRIAPVIALLLLLVDLFVRPHSAGDQTGRAFVVLDLILIGVSLLVWPLLAKGRISRPEHITGRQRLLSMILPAFWLVWSGSSSALDIVQLESIPSFMIVVLALAALLFLRARLLLLLYACGYAVFVGLLLALEGREGLLVLMHLYFGLPLILLGLVINRLGYLTRAQLFHDKLKLKRANSELAALHGELEQQVAERTQVLREEVRQRKQTAEELILFRRFADTSGQGLAMADLDGLVSYANPTLVRMAAAAGPEWLVGRSVADKYAQHHGSDLFARIVRSIRRGEQWIGELELKTADGKLLPTLNNFFLIRDSEGKPLSFAAVITDMSERKRTEQALRNSEELYRSLFEAANDAILIMEGDRFTDCNPRAVRVFDCLTSEIVGSTPLRFSPEFQPDGRPSAEAAGEWMSAAYAGEAQHFAWEHARLDGSPFSAEVSLTRLEVHRRPMLIAIVRDVTERKTTERALHESEEKLAQAQKMEAIGRLAGGVAHDFNNLLTAISGNTDLALLTMKEENPSRRYMLEVQRTARRAANVTRQLLAFGRRQAMRPQVLHLPRVIRQMEGMLRGFLRGDAVELRFQYDRDSWPVKADPTQVEQVLVNLVVNARDAIQAKGLIAVEVENVHRGVASEAEGAGRVSGDCVMLTVWDTGSGMDVEVRNKIFEPFYTTKSEGKGTGLGLATVYGIVNQSGGEILVDSVVGAGTTFRIFLPKSDEVDPALDVELEAELRADRVEGNEEILVAEDDHGVGLLAVNLLERFGYRVILVENGREALAASEQRERPYDLLLSDIIMPELDGVSLANRLRKRWPDMAVLLLTAFSAEALADEGISTEGYETLMKPFKPLDLLRQIRRQLDA